MKFEIRSKYTFITTKWSGGETTEMFIFPKESSYASRDFDFRISSALVQTENSEFTSLPGFSRKLMVLNGTITITHQNHHEITLNEYEVDAFEGDWKTSSIGKCTDFNVMTSKNYKSKLWAEQIESNAIRTFKINPTSKWLLLYLNAGFLTVEKHTIAQGQLVIINELDANEICVEASQKSALVIVELW